MKKEEVERIFTEARTKVHVACDDMHLHTAAKGCLAPKKQGDEPYVTICALCEQLLKMNDAIAELALARSLK